MLNFWLSTMFSIHHMWLFTFSVGKSLQKNTHFSLLMLLFFFEVQVEHFDLEIFLKKQNSLVTEFYS